MSRHKTDMRAGRRGLLGTLGLAAGAMAAQPGAAFDPSGSTGDLRPQKETEAEKRQPRYHVTDHVRAFYRTNRY